MRYEDVVLADGPVGYWPLTELSGTTAKDYGSTGVNGSWSGSPNLGAMPFPAGGRAPYFTGSEYVAIADNNAWTFTSSGFTVEMWVYALNGTISADTGKSYFTKMNSGSNYEWSLGPASFASVSLVQAYSGTLWSPTASQAWAADSTDRSYVDNQSRWIHLVWTGTGVTNTGNSMSIFINGRNQTKQNRGSVSSYANAGSSVHIGFRTDDPAGTKLIGAAAHCAIYNKPLTQARIIAHYRAGLARPTRLPFRTRAA